MRQNIKDAILARLQRNSDFPAMSSTVGILNKFKATEDTSVSELSNIILKDYALTSRILKLVNSVNYAQFGEVTTISRAIILLGFENVKNLALSLVLFDHLQKHGSNSELMGSIIKSFYSAILAQKIAQDINFTDKEEAFICSLFHTFGKIMVAFSMPEKIGEINAYGAEKGVSEDAASLSVIGISYEELGMTIAKEWHFPVRIVQSMHYMSAFEVTDKPNETDRLRSISTFSHRISNIIATSPDKRERDEKIQKLVASFKSHFGSLGDSLINFIDSSAQDLVEFSSTFKLNLENIPLGKVILGSQTGGETSAAGESVRPDFTTESLKTIDLIIESDSESRETPESIFTKGIQDINGAIMSNFSLNDIVRIVLETMYRGMQLSGLSNALFFIKDTRLPVMNVRFGFGSGIEEIKKWFKITLDNSNDIFNIAVMKQGDLVIKDIKAQDVKDLLPDWYKSRISSDIFVVLLPIVIKSKPIGMFYIEGEKGNFKNISAGQLNYLKILRDQTVMAVKQIQGY
jgi:HD-like signal output (HDOD) protein